MNDRTFYNLSIIIYLRRHIEPWSFELMGHVKSSKEDYVWQDAKNFMTSRV